MIKVGITGNIGSGKTHVCKVFEALGIPIYYADLEAHKILNSAECVQEIVSTFGDKVAMKNMEINRKALADIVFKDAQALKQLNQIIHPKLRKDFLLWAEKNQNAAYLMQEAAILFENGFDSTVDYTITVTAPKNTRLQRVMARDGATEEEVLNRMNHQWSDEKKEQAADTVIINDGEHFILPQVLKIHQKLKE